jgi:hypothetical protein
MEDACILARAVDHLLAGDDQAARADLLLGREDACEALEDALRDEPDWAGTLFVDRA